MNGASFLTGDDYFSALNLAPDANERDIKTAYRFYSRLYHPDKHRRLTGAVDERTFDEDVAQMFLKIQHSYEVLIEPNLRQICKLHSDSKVSLISSSFAKYFMYHLSQIIFNRAVQTASF